MNRDPSTRSSARALRRIVKNVSLIKDNIIPWGIFSSSLREWATLCIFSAMETDR